MISIDEFKNKLREFGYYAEDELIYDAYNSLIMFNNNTINPGQDIYATCLEGPPGAGKTEFAKVYAKICESLFKNVELIDYQCDATTGKTELYEDINISAVIRRDAEHVNIPGKLVNAINEVNKGKKVILFIDEYDKAREETDAFLLQFLQSGKINSTQHGDLTIKDEYKGNLQVILCKNDMRENLSGPLSRRIRIIRLDYMKPTVLHDVVKDKYKKINDHGLINLVSYIYNYAYQNKDLYNRLPSCSEILIAIQDAVNLIENAQIPKNTLMKIILKNIFKSRDDLETFTNSIKSSTDTETMKIADLIKCMENKSEVKTNDINQLISEKILNEESTKMKEKEKEFEELISKYEKLFKEALGNLQSSIERENNNIKVDLTNGTLEATSETPKPIKNFEDETNYIKRGYRIFDTFKGDWTNVASIRIPNLSHHFLIDKLKEFSSDLQIKLYEDGILLIDNPNSKLIVYGEKEYKDITYHFMFNHPIIPSDYLREIEEFMKLLFEIFKSQPITLQSTIVDTIMNLKPKYQYNTLIYDESGKNFDLTKIRDNVYVYSYEYEGDEYTSAPLIHEFSCLNEDKAIEASDEILKNNTDRKVLS